GHQAPFVAKRSRPRRRRSADCRGGGQSPGRRRLITTEASSQRGGEVSVEVAHEALIRGWGRLREWVDADRAGLLLHRQLTEAARDWQAHRRESSFLYRGTRLAAAREWAKIHRDQLNDLEAEFLAASVRRKRMAVAALA